MSATAQFPGQVWDGDSSSRSPLDDKAPDFQDWDQIVAEVQAAQNELNAGIDGSNIKTVANANVIGGVMEVIRVDVADATADTDVIMTHKVRVLDVVIVKTTGAGGSGDTLTVKNGSTAITNAMVTNVADKAVVRAGTIDDASHEIAAAGTLRLSANKATNAACTVYVYVIKVA